MRVLGILALLMVYVLPQATALADDRSAPAGMVIDLGDVTEVAFDALAAELSDYDTRVAALRGSGDASGINELDTILRRLQGLESWLMTRGAEIEGWLATYGDSYFYTADLTSARPMTAAQLQEQLAQDYDRIEADPMLSAVESVDPLDALSRDSADRERDWLNDRFTFHQFTRDVWPHKMRTAIRRIGITLLRVRSLAGEVVTARDALRVARAEQVVIRNAPGGADPAVCLRQSVAMTATARLVGFGVNDDTAYPMRGNYICDSDASFWWIDGLIMRHFICASADACRENLSLGYQRNPQAGGGSRLLTDNGAMVIIEALR